MIGVRQSQWDLCENYSCDSPRTTRPRMVKYTERGRQLVAILHKNELILFFGTFIFL